MLDGNKRQIKQSLGRGSGMGTNSRSLMGGASAIALLLLGPVTVAAQTAGNARTASQIEEVVVTGSSIKGVAPIGSNLVTVGREELDKVAAVNATELTNTVPAISTARSDPVGQNSL